MGPGAGHRAATMTALQAVIERECAAVSRAAGLAASPVTIDPAQLLMRDRDLATPGEISPNGSCRLVQALDGWIAVNLPRSEDREAVPAWLECTAAEDIWPVIMREAAKRPTGWLIERAQLLQLAVTAAGETAPALPKHLHPATRPPASTLRGIKVVDLSVLWAGPLAAGLLAMLGADVTRIESEKRPDPGAQTTPMHDQWLNGAKHRIKGEPGDTETRDMIAGADILVTSARQHILARHGLTPEALFAANPRLIWIAITAHGWAGDNGLRTGFGDDCAAAGGLLDWQNGAPRFIGDALADPLCGLLAARQALVMLAAGRAGLLDCALAPSAAWFAREAGIRA
ncbi:MAG: CoA transferase [Blastomonas sp.]